MAQPNWVVLEAVPRPDHTIELDFVDGKHGLFDMRPLLDDAYYAPLAAVPLFMTGHVECGTVVWANDMDIAPELLYEMLQPEEAA